MVVLQLMSDPLNSDYEVVCLNTCMAPHQRTPLLVKVAWEGIEMGRKKDGNASDEEKVLKREQECVIKRNM